MEIKLNVYESNSSKEPMKVYSCYGLSFETIIKFEDYQKKSSSADLKEQMELIYEFLVSVFGEFDKDHLLKIRPNDLHDFMLSIGQVVKGEYVKAEKN